jgi:hypothetical protein
VKERDVKVEEKRGEKEREGEEKSERERLQETGGKIRNEVTLAKFSIKRLI